MRALLTLLLGLLLVGSLGLGGLWIWAGRAPGPVIELRQPGAFIGSRSALELVVDAPGGHFTRIDATVEQGEKRFPVFSLTGGGGSDAKQESADRLYIRRPVGKSSMPQLQAGPGPDCGARRPAGPLWPP